MHFSNLKEKILNRYWVISEKIRQRVSTHPKIIVWRLRLFGYSPFLGKHVFKILLLIIASAIFYTSLYLISWRAPSNFPEHNLVTVERGIGLSGASEVFENENVVRSSFWLKTFIFLMGGEKRVVAGDYYFPERVSVFRVAKMLHDGKFGLISIRTTIQEGLSSFEIADLLEKELPAFDREEFLTQVDEENLEGYLFPDTYFFMPNSKASDVIATMREAFAREFKTYEEDFVNSGRTLPEIVIMASIIEGEAGDLESKRIVSGILWNRIKKKMPLQVDAPFKYYNGKNSYTLTKDDLAEDHPYNTYVNKGLPATAINNPGIDSIRAAIAPTASNYYYFLSDKEGNMYYAKNFDGHQANREAYLR